MISCQTLVLLMKYGRKGPIAPIGDMNQHLFPLSLEALEQDLMAARV